MSDGTNGAGEERSRRGRRRWREGASGGAGGAVYSLGFVGAVVYYIQTATSFGDGVLGVLKAVVWPAMLVYHWLQYLHM